MKWYHSMIAIWSPLSGSAQSKIEMIDRRPFHHLNQTVACCLHAIHIVLESNDPVITTIITLHVLKSIAFLFFNSFPKQVAHVIKI